MKSEIRRPKPAAAITEAEWQAQVIDLARMLRWRVAHFRPALTKHGWRTPVAADGKGYPDLCLVRERIIFAELKSATGQPSPEQQTWAQAITQAGIEMYLWRPQDLEQVADVLRRKVPDGAGKVQATRSGTDIPAIGNAGKGVTA